MKMFPDDVDNGGGPLGSRIERWGKLSQMFSCPEDRYSSLHYSELVQNNRLEAQLYSLATPNLILLEQAYTHTLPSGVRRQFDIVVGKSVRPSITIVFGLVTAFLLFLLMVLQFSSFFYQ